MRAGAASQPGSRGQQLAGVAGSDGGAGAGGDVGRSGTPGGDAASASGSGSGSAGGRAGLIVFCRLPVPGRVKTRLAAGVGPQAACDWYRACALHGLAQAASCGSWADAFVYHSSADATADVEAWLAADGLGALPCLPQASTGGGGGAGAGDLDLGSKMLAAMQEVQRKGPHVKVLITGTDIPGLSAELFRTAADALDKYEAVLGPAMDGGYYMLGLTRLDARLFTGMPWSTDTVLQETLARASAASLRMAPLDTLPALRDIDTRQDLEEWTASVASGQEPVEGTLECTGRDAAAAAAAGTAGHSASQDQAPGGDGAGTRSVDARRQELLRVSQRVLREAAAAVQGARRTPGGCA